MPPPPHSHSLLKLARHALSLRGAAAAPEAERYLRQALALGPLSTDEETDGAAANSDFPTPAPAELYLFLGQVLELQATPAQLEDALASYDLAYASASAAAVSAPTFPVPGSSPTPAPTASGSDDAPADSLLHARAVAQMNRGNVLQKLERPADALGAYDLALDLFQRIRAPATEFHSSLAALWLNRGAALRALSTADSLTQAIASFQASIDLLQSQTGAPVFSSDSGSPTSTSASTAPSSLSTGPSLAGPAPTHSENLLGSARLALAAALIALPFPDLPGALSQAYAVLTDASRIEADHLPSGDLALRARLLICEALGLHLATTPTTSAAGITSTATGLSVSSTQSPTPDQRRQWLNESTDRAEEALRHAAGWERRGIVSFRPSVGWFLQFAATLYAQFQPQFLAEFLHEFLCSEDAPPDWAAAPDLREIALNAIARARTGLHARLFEAPDSAEAAPLTEALAALRRIHELLLAPR